MDAPNIDLILAWIRQYYVVCVAVYLGVAVTGVWLTGKQTAARLWGAVTLLLATYATGVAYHFPFTNDDSFIFFRYAMNLAGGAGYCYNPGVPCEGFTSPAWLWLVTLPAKLRWPLEESAKSIGVMFGGLAIVFILATLRRLTKDLRVFFLTGYIVVTQQVFLAWIPSGMDAALFVAWIAWLVWELAREDPAVWRLLAGTAVGVWIRPEAYIFLAVAWSYWMVRTARARGWPHVAVVIGGVIIVAALPFAWRWMTFGELAPVTYYAKSDRTLRSGIGFLFGAVQGYGPAIWAIALVGLWHIRRSRPWCLAGVTLIAVYVVLVGGDVLIQRFSLWWLPLLAVGLAVGIHLLKRMGVLASGRVVALILLLFAARELHRMYSVTRAMSENDGYVYVSANAIHTAEADTPIGIYLREHGSPKDTCVTDNIGAIGYYSDMVIRDVNGLVDIEMATLIRDNRRDAVLASVAKTHPKWIVCYVGTDSVKTYHLATQQILPPAIVDAYDEVHVWRSRTGYTRALLRAKPAGSHVTH